MLAPFDRVRSRKAKRCHRLAPQLVISGPTLRARRGGGATIGGPVAGRFAVIPFLRHRGRQADVESPLKRRMGVGSDDESGRSSQPAPTQTADESPSETPSSTPPVGWERYPDNSASNSHDCVDALHELDAPQLLELLAEELKRRGTDGAIVRSAPGGFIVTATIGERREAEWFSVSQIRRLRQRPLATKEAAVA